MVYSHKIHHMKYGINDNCMLYRLYNSHGGQVCDRAGGAPEKLVASNIIIIM